MKFSVSDAHFLTFSQTVLADKHTYSDDYNEEVLKHKEEIFTFCV